MSDSLNNRIGDYEILGVLGAGGMGQVYRVRNVISDRIEAMKILLPSLSDHRDVGERFQREIKLVASLHHPNIATLCTAQTIENRLVMVMEFVDGDTLSDLLDRRALSLGDALEYFDQALAALSYAHSKGIVHRDIKPSNIMLTAEGVVKLMDFGIARNDADRALTQTGATVGTVSYMSPEQIAGKKTDNRSDLYSMGILLYETITGQQPFRGSSDYEVMAAHVHQEPRPLIDVVPDVPATLNYIVLRLLAKDPAERFQTAAAVRESIHLLQQSGEISQALPRPGANSAPGRAATVVESRNAPATLVSAAAAFNGTGFTNALARGSSEDRAMTQVSGRPLTQVAGSQAYNAAAPAALAVRKTGLARHPLAYGAAACAAAGALAVPLFLTHRSADTGPKTVAAAVTGVAPATGGAALPSAPGATPGPAPGGNAGKPAAPQAGHALIPPARPVSTAVSLHGQAPQPGVATVAASGKVYAPGGAATPTQPTASPEVKARLDAEELQIDQLESRAVPINNSLNTMQRSMQKDGVSMRGDIAGKQASMNTNLAKAKQAWTSGDAERAGRFAALAQTEAGELESFLGR